MGGYPYKLQSSWKHRKTAENIGKHKVIWYHPENNWRPIIDNLLHFEEGFNSRTEKSRVVVGLSQTRPILGSPDGDNKKRYLNWTGLMHIYDGNTCDWSKILLLLDEKFFYRHRGAVCSQHTVNIMRVRMRFKIKYVFVHSIGHLTQSARDLSLKLHPLLYLWYIR